MSMTPEEKKARLREQKRRYWEANKEANKEKNAERQRRYREANKDQETERLHRWREGNKEKQTEQQRRWREANKENHAEMQRRWLRRKRFAGENGSSFEGWLASIYNRSAVFKAIANLQPDPGQTLAELIHELSGYAMEVCEQIANPPVIEDPQPTQPTPQPDLF